MKYRARKRVHRRLVRVHVDRSVVGTASIFISADLNPFTARLRETIKSLTETGSSASSAADAISQLPTAPVKPAYAEQFTEQASAYSIAALPSKQSRNRWIHW